MEKVPQSADYPTSNTVFVLQPTEMTTRLLCVSKEQNFLEMILSTHLVHIILQSILPCDGAAS